MSNAPVTRHTFNRRANRLRSIVARVERTGTGRNANATADAAAAAYHDLYVTLVGLEDAGLEVGVSQDRAATLRDRAIAARLLGRVQAAELEAAAIARVDMLAAA